MLKDSEWLLVNRLTAGIFRIEDEKQMRLFCLNQLKELIDFDVADFYVPASGKAKGKNRIMGNPVYITSINPKKTDDFIHEYNAVYQKMDYMNWINFVKRSVVFSEEDLIGQKNREICPYYTDYLVRYDLPNVAGISIVNSEVCVGALDLYRSARKGNYSERDIFILEQIEPHLAIRLFDDYKKNKNYENPLAALQQKYTLTNRETEVVKLTMMGKSTDEIAADLEISISTVKKHLGNIFWKIGIKNRLQLVKLLIEEGLIV